MFDPVLWHLPNSGITPEVNSLKIIKPFMSEELLEFQKEARECRAKHEKPRNPSRFYMSMATGTFRLHPQEINDLASTFEFFAFHENSENLAYMAPSVAGACAESEADSSNAQALSYFLETAVEALSEYKKITDPSVLHSWVKSVNKLVVKHLPHLSVGALGLYIEHSRKLTHWADPNFNEMSYHPETGVLNHPVITESFSGVKPNQALTSIIEHFFASDVNSYFVDEEFDYNSAGKHQERDAIAKLTALGSVFIKLAEAKHYLPIKYPDLVLVATLIDRFAIAAASAPSDQERDFFSQAAVSITSLCTNFPKNKASKDHNLFLRDGSGFDWIGTAPSKALEPVFVRLISSPCPFNGAAEIALREFHWSILKTAMRVHSKHKESGYDNSGLVAGLIPWCTSKILDPDNLAPFGAVEIGVLISGVSDLETKRVLLSRHKESRGQVLMDSMGL
jgi:hypothetical protein